MHLGQFEVQYLTGRWPPLPPEPQLGLTFSSQIPGSHIFWDWAYFQDDFSIKSKCQNSPCHSASWSYFWSVDVTTQKHRTVCLVTFMDDIPRSADAKSSLSYSLLSLLLIFFLVQSMSLLFFPSLLGLGETSCFLTDVTYSPKSLFRSVNPAFFRLMLKLSCGSVQVCWPCQSHLFGCFLL